MLLIAVALGMSRASAAGERGSGALQQEHALAALAPLEVLAAAWQTGQPRVRRRNVWRKVSAWYRTRAVLS